MTHPPEVEMLKQIGEEIRDRYYDLLNLLDDRHREPGEPINAEAVQCQAAQLYALSSLAVKASESLIQRKTANSVSTMLEQLLHQTGAPEVVPEAPPQPTEN